MKFIDRNTFILEDYRLSAEEFNLKRQEQPKPVILDIRPTEEVVGRHLEGSHNLPAETLEQRLISLPPFGTIIIFSNSENANIETSMHLLWENGFSDIFYVDGGYEGILRGLVQLSQEIFENGAKTLSDFNTDGTKGLRVETLGYDYEVHPVTSAEEVAGYLEIPYEGLSVYVQPKRLKFFDQTSIDFKNGVFLIDNPRMHLPKPDGTISERITSLLNEQINPSIASHGGYITLLEVKEETAYIEMGGGCQGCGMSKMTLKQGVEGIIFDNIPEITQILDVTDHAAGDNPYYRPEV